MSLYPAMLVPTGTDAAVLTDFPREQAATQATACVAVCARGFYWCLRAVARIPEGRCALAKQLLGFVAEF